MLTLSDFEQPVGLIFESAMSNDHFQQQFKDNEGSEKSPIESVDFLERVESLRTDAVAAARAGKIRLPHDFTPSDWTVICGHGQAFNHGASNYAFLIDAIQFLSSDFLQF